jgi:hypothetical protein
MLPEWRGLGWFVLIGGVACRSGSSPSAGARGEVLAAVASASGGANGHPLSSALPKAALDVAGPPRPSASDATDQPKAMNDGPPDGGWNAKLRAFTADTPARLENAVVPVSKRFLQRDSKLVKRHRCSEAEVIPVQGYYDEQPVRGTIELLKNRIAVKVEPLKGPRASYRGTLDHDICGEDTDLNSTGQLASSSAKSAAMEITLKQQSYFDTDRGRLKLEGSEPGSSVPSLELWDTPRERLELRNAYQQALQSSDDVEVVVKASNGSLLLAVLELGSRRLGLVQVGGSPPKKMRAVATDLSCEYHQCNAGLDAFEISPELTLLVPSVFGQNCGNKCTEQAEGQLWTLTPDGFHRGHSLPEGYETPGGLTYEGSSSRITVSWADGDGAPPLELLVETSESPAKRFIAGFDPGARSYSQWKPLADAPEESMAPLRGSTVVSY